MADALLDSDVLIDHLRGARELRLDSRLAYSSVTRAELFAGTDSGRDAVAVALAPMIELPVDRSVAERAGSVRRQAGIRLPDALIAATALVHGLPVITRNRRDFDRVAGLEIVAP